LTLLRLEPEHRALALELGANTPGEIASLAAICRPTVGAVTVVASAHMEFFGSLDGVAEEKSALVRAIPPDGAQHPSAPCEPGESRLLPAASRRSRTVRDRTEPPSQGHPSQ